MGELCGWNVPGRFVKRPITQSLSKADVVLTVQLLFVPCILKTLEESGGHMRIPTLSV